MAKNLIYKLHDCRTNVHLDKKCSLYNILYIYKYKCRNDN